MLLTEEQYKKGPKNSKLNNEKLFSKKEKVYKRIIVYLFPRKRQECSFYLFFLSVRCFHLRVQTSFWNLPPLDASNKSHNMILIISFGSISNLHRDGCLFVMLFTVFILRPKRSGRISTIGEEITIQGKKMRYGRI